MIKKKKIKKKTRSESECLYCHCATGCSEMEQGTRPRNRKTMTNWFLQHIREEEGKKNNNNARLSGCQGSTVWI